jgi:plastocyanin
MPTMLRPSNLFLALLFTALAATIACSSSSGSTSGAPADAGGGGDTGGGDSGGEPDAAEDAGDVEVNSCKVFVDRSAAGASRTLTWDFGIATAPERCLTIKKGQAVTFSGDFATHPLLGSGGDKPNPLASADPSTGIVTFAATGTFGFVCGNHPAMTGAIKVIE